MKIAVIVLSIVVVILLLALYFVSGRLSWYKDCYYVEVARNNDLRNQIKEDK